MPLSRVKVAKIRKANWRRDYTWIPLTSMGLKDRLKCFTETGPYEGAASDVVVKRVESLVKPK